MTSDISNEFGALRDLAQHRLNTVPWRKTLVPAFSYWVLPSFHDSICHTLYFPGSSPHLDPTGSSAVFITRTWCLTVDQDKLRNPVERLRHPRHLEPTIKEITGLVPGEIATDVIARLSALSLPSLALTDSMVGTDGTHFRLAYERGYHSLDLRWWANHPAPWQATARDIDALVAKLELARQLD